MSGYLVEEAGDLEAMTGYLVEGTGKLDAMTGYLVEETGDLEAMTGYLVEETGDRPFRARSGLEVLAAFRESCRGLSPAGPGPGLLRP